MKQTPEKIKRKQQKKKHQNGSILPTSNMIKLNCDLAPEGSICFIITLPHSTRERMTFMVVLLFLFIL